MNRRSFLSWLAGTPLVKWLPVVGALPAAKAVSQTVATPTSRPTIFHLKLGSYAMPADQAARYCLSQSIPSGAIIERIETKILYNLEVE